MSSTDATIVEQIARLQNETIPAIEREVLAAQSAIDLFRSTSPQGTVPALLQNGFFQASRRLQNATNALQALRNQVGSTLTPAELTAEVQALQAGLPGLRTRVADTRTRLDALQQFIAGGGVPESGGVPISPADMQRAVQEGAALLASLEASLNRDEARLALLTSRPPPANLDAATPISPTPTTPGGSQNAGNDANQDAAAEQNAFTQVVGGLPVWAWIIIGIVLLAVLIGLVWLTVVLVQRSSKNSRAAAAAAAALGDSSEASVWTT